MTIETLTPQTGTNDDSLKLYPPLQVWKVALLLVCTLSIYTMVWLYRVAKDVRTATGTPVSPWMWIFAPLTGLSAMIANSRLTGMLQKWAASETVETGKLIKPAIIGGLTISGHVVLIFSDKVSLWWPLWLLGVTLLIAPILLLQKQLNAIKLGMAPSRFHTAPMRFTELQKVAVGVCGFVSVAIIGIILAADLSGGTKKQMTVGRVLTDTNEKYQLKILVPGWSQIKPGRNSQDGDLEFVTDRLDDWAIVFSMPDTGMDGRATDRVDWIRESYPGAKCTENRRLAENGAVVIGILDCFGNDFLYDHYQFRSYVITNDEMAVEVFMFINAPTVSKLKRRAPLLQLAEGLTLL